MAVYTIELYKLLQTDFDIGLRDYTLPDFCAEEGIEDEWRAQLNRKIINHYMFREIGSQPDRFRIYLNNTMNEIMPRYAMLFDALHKDWSFDSGSTWKETFNDGEHTGAVSTFDNNTDSTDTNHAEGKTHDESSTNSSNYSLSVDSATPGQMLNIEDDIANNTYADSANKSKGNASSGSESDGTSASDSNSKGNVKATGTGNNNVQRDRMYERTEVGVKNRSLASLYKEYMEALTNLELELMEDLEPCFMSVF